ncbi:MAG: hydroxymethylpyrimidine/phosphomethylpyrimidine kinase [Candidatus Eremiobacteraeota bacterium]|nr:hydroxymethylpyrimidine/phosphomethylpyrimidine kinase [Candidatus Eremiobacteraeota bacterium]
MVCSIGTVDPLAASGLGADLRVYEKLGAQPLLVVTAVTAQNSARVTAVQPVPARTIVQQLRSIWEQVRPDAVCIGLIPQASGIRAVRNFLSKLPARPPVVLDPVLRSSSGYALSSAAAGDELMRLLPLVSIVTPNASEAARLALTPVTNFTQARAAAVELSSYGCAVLLTGGHLPGQVCTDVFASLGRVHALAHKRIAGSMRGSGGILAAAISVHLARGDKPLAAIRKARRIVQSAMRAARPLGNGPPQL